MNFSKLGRVDKIQAKENEMKQVIAGEMETWTHWCKSSSNSLCLLSDVTLQAQEEVCSIMQEKEYIYRRWINVV